jgi:crotonobetainyl-CoA:carnitine CoA-transferase CaiB-like acyl-CoA transferase
LFAGMSKGEMTARLDRAGAPFAPINKPADLFEDEHLNQSGGLIEITLSDGSAVKLPALPLEMNGSRPGLYKDLPAPGADARTVLADAGYDTQQISSLMQSGIVRTAGGD